ncbi:hypothetical protein BKG82_00040 [Mycobacteroides chelonae]|uniref:Uncharacterized protein n=1 Tax=Mycobacteroides chelonae TaxID=1774 RepID=A0A1S1LRG0_MYCCH|nr:hypothetical protein AOT91_24870 [Mycobacteroides sp. H092]KRQ26660.1 hypothetical protein AOT87_01155 [Mycobacteroides sp. H003]KRQ51767.1 hypothetical protein AOT88_05005 [Mycobacteroides sp. H063]KRQ61481.1 hypothetical protein AOT94_05415 [Mycobacteroides sp. HXVII]KRQ64799.1 hypothetical protein AOT89_16965 [Mycobacteroides sp. H070]KRQ74423.1 hypothetical protein AOT93_26005 [Mycobacteroides sp. H110]KRQ77083.1 hypothetical protein AOT95_23665 [Mycobacteroides sp. HXXIII]OHU27800.1 
MGYGRQLRAYYRLQLSDYDENRDISVYVTNWDEGQGLAAASAADRGCSMVLRKKEPDYADWWMYRGTFLVGIVSLERSYQ